jgi:tetratricopeptide (TPR) repeat protein
MHRVGWTLALGVVWPLLTIGCGGEDSRRSLSSPRAIDEYRHRAGFLEREGDPIEALEAYRDATRRFPTEAWTWSGVGRVASALGRSRDARDAFLEAVRWDSTRVEDRVALARIALIEGRAEEALTRIDEAIAIGSETPARRALRGRVLAEAGRLPEARTEVERALLQAPDDPEIRIARLFYRLRADSGSTVLAEADDLVARFPESADVLFARARVRRDLGDLPGAREDLEAGLALAARRPRARLELARLLAAEGRSSEAAEAFRAVLEDNPRDPAALEGLGTCALETGDPEAAEMAFREAIRSDSEFAPAYLALGRFLSRAGRPEESVTLLRKARARASLEPALWEECGLTLAETYLRLDEAGNALDIVDGILKRNPDSEAARTIRGRALAAGGNGFASGSALERLATRPEASRDEILAYAGWLLERESPERAIDVLARILERDPGDREARTLRAEALSALGRIEDAEIELHDILGGEPPFPPAQLALARLYLRANRYPDAIYHAREGAKLAPADPEFLGVIGLAQLESGRPHEAREAFDRELELRPDLPDAHIHQGQLEMRLGRGGAAVPHFERARELDPRSWLPSHLLGLALTAVGRTEEAVEAYRSVLARDERIAEAHNNLAWLLADLDIDPILAEVHARRAAELQPENPHVLGTLGWAQYKNRLLDEAAVSLKAATLRVPDDPMKRYMLGVVQSARGESDEARREIGRALELDPAFPRAESARDLLARLDR